MRGRQGEDGEGSGGLGQGEELASTWDSSPMLQLRENGITNPKVLFPAGGLHFNLQAFAKAMEPGLLSRVQLPKDGVIVAEGADGEDRVPRAPEGVEIWRSKRDMLSLISLPSPTFILLLQTCH